MATFVRVAIALALVTAPSVAWSQQPAASPKPYVNLQVLPKDSKPDALIQTMKTFTRSLGVRCQFCHIGKEGQPLSEFDFVADTNPNKNIARNMIRMAAEINTRLAKDVEDSVAKGYQVSCFTCHRGAEHPVHSPDAAPAKPPGA